MTKKQKIHRLLEVLMKKGIGFTPDFEDDLNKLVTSNVNKFIKDFDFDMEKNIDDYNRFEKLHLSSKDRQRMDGNILQRYEYRNTSNLRCIFFVYKENNKDMPIFLCAFNEDGDKTKGPNAYKANVERAIRIYEGLKREGER